MFLARIDGTLTSTRKHATLEGVRFLIAQRLEADGSGSGEPIVVLDRMGAARGTIALVSTDGSLAREWLGKTAPARLVVVGLVDTVHVGSDLESATFSRPDPTLGAARRPS